MSRKERKRRRRINARRLRRQRVHSWNLLITLEMKRLMQIRLLLALAFLSLLALLNINDYPTISITFFSSVSPLSSI